MSVSAVSVPESARPVPPLRRRLLLAAVSATGAALVVAGVMLPWLTYYAGLFQLGGLRSASGDKLLALAASSIVMALAAAARPLEAIRWAIALLGAVEVLFAAHLLANLNTSLAGAGQMLVARSGPGLYLSLAGGVVTFGVAFLPLSQHRRRVPDASAASAGLAAPIGPIYRSLAEAAGLRKHVPARRRLQLALGALWLADAALQSQPYMFTRAFAASTLAATARSSPSLLAATIARLDHVVAAQPVLCNELFVATELVVALLLFRRETVKLGLAASAAWGLVVWVLGEGVGLLLPARGTPLAGSPGAGLLYLVASVLLWPAASRQASTARQAVSVAESSPIGRRGARAAMIALFALLAWETWPRAGTVRATGGMFLAMRQGEPALVASLDRWAASAILHHGTLLLGLLAAVLLITGPAVAFGRLLGQAAIAFGLVVSLALFLLQDFGGIATGYASDVSTAPVLALIIAAYWRPRPRPAEAAPICERHLRFIG